MKINKAIILAFVVSVAIIVAFMNSSIVSPKFLANSKEARHTPRQRQPSGEQKHDKWIVVTTIQPPTESMFKFASLPGWKLVVVGDKKGPVSWNLPGSVFLDVAAQESLQYKINKFLPYNNYGRKMIGYLYAIENGAQYIYDSDDDNYVVTMDPFQLEKRKKSLVINTDDAVFNIYAHFGQLTMWPRGFPLEKITSPVPTRYHLCNADIPAIQQTLAEVEPDLDGIFRLTRRKPGPSLDNPLHFDNVAPAVVLPKGSFTPFNAQTTLFMEKAFWSLAFPS